MVASSPRNRLAPESKRFDVELTVVSLTNLRLSVEEETLVSVDVKWKGPKSALGSRFRKSQKKDNTPAEAITGGGAAIWKEAVSKFKHQCVLLGAKSHGHEEAAYQPWDVNFVILKAAASAPEKTTALGKASLDLSEYGSGLRTPWTTLQVETEGKGAESTAELKVRVSLVELRNEDGPTTLDTAAPTPKRSSRLSHRLVRSRSLTVLEDLKLPAEPLMTSSMMSSDADDEAEYEAPGVELPLKYSSMVASNLAAALGATELAEVDRAVIQPLPQSAVLERTVSVPLPEASDGEEEAGAKEEGASKSRGLFKKRKLSFRSPKGDPLLWTKEKEEPLLNKVKAEEEEEVVNTWESPYTDSSSAEHGKWLDAKRAGLPPSLSSDSLSASDGNYSSDAEEEHKVGAWQLRQIVSREGSSRMMGEVFFASFDQRSESAAGESACTALVAVIADWLHQHPGQMPTKAVFNQLIQEGSREWRALCEMEEFKERFKDRHFDLETVLGARIRPLKVDHFHSFVGFFKPPDMEASHEMLAGSMSFDEIWGELAKAGEGVYIVSWNDHFFILKVDEARCYIIDTLGERLVEGCSRAFMLRFEGGCCCQQVAETKAEIRREEEEKAAAAQAEKDRAAGPKKKQKPSPYAGGLSRTTSGVPKASEKEDSPKGAGLGRTLSMSTLGALLGRTSSGSFGAGSKSAEKAAQVAKEELTGKATAAAPEGKDGKDVSESVSEGEKEGAGADEKEVEECGLGRGMCKGRHFVRDFLAAVPLRALAEDLRAKRAVPVHQRLQIEFNYTRLLDLFNEKDVKKLG